MKTINYAKCQERLIELRRQTEGLLQYTGNQDLIQKLDDELDSAFNRQKLSIAFVGQYSSGKSTIVSAMTGNKHIKIDANVATDKVSKYEWRDITLLDTPGILAGKFEHHDQATLNALKESDLIFYVLTSHLFDDVVFNNFIDLAYNQHLADKMFIVINKMGMESGVYNELVQNYMSSLRGTFAERGYNVDDFPIAFIDANDYIDGVVGNNVEFVELSHFDQFLDMLNAFVDQKGLIKKQLDTPIRILQSYLKNIEVSEVDKTQCNFYVQFEQMLTSSEREIKRDVQQVLYSFDTSTMNEVIQLSNEIGSIDEEEWKQKQEKLDKELSKMILEASNNIEDTIKSAYERLLQEVHDFSGKEALVKYAESIEVKINSPEISVEEKKRLKVQLNSLELLRKGGEGVSKLAPGVGKLGGGISGASGSQLHKIVLDTGHFFGKSFVPWEAVRWASNIAKFAKFGIPVLTSGVEIWMQVSDDRKEDKRLEQIKVAKSQFVTAYQGEINNVKSKFNDSLQPTLNNYANKRDEINRSKDDLVATINRNQELKKSIEKLEGEYVDFIDMVNGRKDLVRS